MEELELARVNEVAATGEAAGALIDAEEEAEMEEDTDADDEEVAEE